MNLGQLCSNKITVREMLGIGSGKADCPHGPEVEYHVKREYSPDENGYAENYKLISVPAQASPVVVSAVVMIASQRQQ